jgi:hypothetical protein
MNALSFRLQIDLRQLLMSLMIFKLISKQKKRKKIRRKTKKRKTKIRLANNLNQSKNKT